MATQVVIGLATGKERWRHATGADIWSTAAVSENAVYFGSYDWHVYALDKATGALVWKYRTNDWVQSTPTVHADVIYFGSGDDAVYALR